MSSNRPSGERRRGPRPSRFAAIRPARLVLILLITLPLASLIVAMGWAASLRGLAPERALSLAPWDAGAHARVAERALAPEQKATRIAPAQVEKAESAARYALARAPATAAAWRTLGYVAALRNEERRALSLFQTSESFSRRDSPTQIWLIEHAVRNGNIADALGHYDIALRTSPGTRALLLPILVQAASDPAIRAPLGRLLKRRPPWTEEFISTLVTAPAQPETVAAVLAVMRRAGPLPFPMTIIPYVNQLATKDEVAVAERIYRLLKQPVARAVLLRNGAFEAENALPPLDWALTQAGGIDALVEGGRLQVRGAADAAGLAAYQKLLLEPGRYRLSSRVGSEAGAAAAEVSWVVLCNGADGRELLKTRVQTTSADGSPVQALFEVPPGGCGVQALQIVLSPVDDPAGAAAWIDDVTIVSATVRT